MNIIITAFILMCSGYCDLRSGLRLSTFNTLDAHITVDSLSVLLSIPARGVERACLSAIIRFTDGLLKELNKQIIEVATIVGMSDRYELAMKLNSKIELIGLQAQIVPDTYQFDLSRPYVIPIN